MKDRSYKVCLIVDGTGNIDSANCECPRGNWLCSHMAATAIYVNKKGFSKTNLPNSWIARPKQAKKKESGTRMMSDFFQSPKPDYSATTREVNKEDADFLLAELVQRNVDCPFQWIISPEETDEMESIAPPLIEELLPLFIKDKNAFLDKIKVTDEQIKWVAEKSKGQRKSHYWGMYRRLRLTASNFGMVIKAVIRHEATGRAYPPSIFKALRGEYNLEKKDPIIWGQMHEEEALKIYKEKTGNTVLPSGLQLFPCGYLGCSPDGIITTTLFGASNGALEIKCPWKYRDSTIPEMIEKEKAVDHELKNFYLTENLEINPNHNYWHQVQAEMSVLKATWAHFVIWTKKQVNISTVYKDPNWEKENFPKLSKFYLDELLPTIYTKDD